MIEYSEISTVEARSRFADLVNRVAQRKEWILLTRRGKPVAAAVPLEQFEYFEGPEGSTSPQDMATFDDIMTRAERIRAEAIGEAPVAYQVDNRIHRITTAEARNNLSDVLNRVCFGKERIILTRRDWDLLALIPPDVFDEYLRIDELEDEIDGRAAEEALRDSEGTISWEEFKKKLDLE